VCTGDRHADATRKKKMDKLMMMLMLCAGQAGRVLQ